MDKKLGVKEVIENGYCIGCGVCAYAQPSAFKMDLNNYGQFKAVIIHDNYDPHRADKICPFSDFSPNEDHHGEFLFPQNGYIDTLGKVHSTYAGFVTEGDFRKDGSSGGMGSWLCVEILKQGMVDGVIHLKTSESEKLFFEYGLSDTVEEIATNSKSRYYPVKMDEVLSLIREKRGKYLFVGIPCMIKALRSLAMEDEMVAESITFTLGLVCGHIKSTAFAELLGWQLGVRPSDLYSIDFRTKLEGYGSNQYGVTVGVKSGKDILKHVSKPVNEMFGTNWGLGYFKSKACDFCDDVTAETADITIGDAWLPEYVNDSQGTNIIVVRNKIFAKLLKDAAVEGRVHLDSLTPERIIESQSSGINHRRLGLQYRLYINERANMQSPVKRVVASDQFPSKFKKIQQLRVALRDESNKSFFEAKKTDDLSLFFKKMKGLNEEYAALYRKTLPERIINKLKRLFR